MAKNSDLAISWGAGAEGLDAGVYVAAASIAVPTTLGDLVAPDWDDVGWLSDAGITQSHTVDTTDKNAFQGAALIKRLKTGESHSFNFQCLEENAVVLGLLRPGSTRTVAAGLATTHVKSATGSDIRSFAIDLRSTGVAKQMIARKAEVTSFGDIVYQSTDLTVYEFTVTAYPDENGDYFVELSNVDTAVAS